jgi:hypothetical protein
MGLARSRCYTRIVEIPRVELARLSSTRRLGRWIVTRFSPPGALIRSRGFGAASYWSLTGALAAGFTMSLYLLLLSGMLWEADFVLTLGWAVFAVFGVVFWFWPFVVSYYMYVPLGRLRILRTRPGAAAYGALWHTAAHCLLVSKLGSETVSAVLVVPVLVGGLWGSWLPAAVRRAPALSPR